MVEKLDTDSPDRVTKKPAKSYRATNNVTDDLASRIKLPGSKSVKKQDYDVVVDDIEPDELAASNDSDEVDNELN